MAKIKVKLLDDVIKGLEEKKDFSGRWCKDYKPSCGSITADPYECTNCHWKSYGLLKFNLAFLYCKKERKGVSCFMPKALKKEIQA